MTTDQFNAIKARYEAASEGPWKICKEDGVDIIGNDSEIILELSGKTLGCTVRPYNFKFIAHARTDLPACLEEIERLKKALQKIIDESGKVDIANWPAQQQICQAIARKALEQ